MKSMGGVIGWFALIAALVVPALLFYNWWNKMNATKKDQAQESSFRIKTPIFKKSEDTGPSSVQQGSRPSLESSGGRSPSPKAEGSRPFLIIGFSTASADSSEQIQPPAPVGRSTSARSAVPPLTPAASSQAKVTFSPKVDRDPTLSQEDRDWLRDEEERKRMMWQKDKKPEIKRKRPEDMVRLQGIIETAKGKQAIINGGAYKQGSFVRGIRVVKIKSTSVVFDYKGRRFVKRISQ